MKTPSLPWLAAFSLVPASYILPTIALFCAWFLYSISRPAVQDVAVNATPPYNDAPIPGEHQSARRGPLSSLGALLAINNAVKKY